MKSLRCARLVACLLAVMTAASARAASADASCRTIDDDAQRLACYDLASERTAPTQATVPVAAQDPYHAAAPQPPAPESAPLSSRQSSTLSTAWDLDPALKHGTFTLLPYKPNYVMPVRWTNSANVMPTSPSPDNRLSGPLPVQATEAKFQLSVKLKAWQNIFGDNGDLWLGYTQQSNWQLYNSADSRPFRETDYSPELMLAFRTDYSLFGWRWRLFNFGLQHQSNGRADPLSRSWNRVYAMFGVEHGDLTVQWKPWYRLKESAKDDDNPDIERYLGWSDLRLSYQRNGHIYSAQGRYSFSSHRGGLQLEWGFPLAGALKGYLQLTTGYGESLIDYNHAQTTIGLGVLLLPW